MNARIAWLLTVVAFLLGCAVGIVFGGRPWVRSATVADAARVSAAASTAEASASANASDDSEGAATPASSSGPKAALAEVAGVHVGSLDNDVVRLYGAGLFTSLEGHSGGRYYVDPAHRVTVHVVTGTDGTIDGVTLTSGVSLPEGMRLSDDPQVISWALSANPAMSRGVQLGMSFDQVRVLLGKPFQDTRTGVQRVVTYDNEDNDGAGQWTELRFVGDELRNVWISDTSD